MTDCWNFWIFNLQLRLSRPSNLVKCRHYPFLPLCFPPLPCQRHYQHCFSFFLFIEPTDTNLRACLLFPPLQLASLSPGEACKPSLMASSTFKCHISEYSCSQVMLLQSCPPFLSCCCCCCSSPSLSVLSKHWLPPQKNQDHHFILRMITPSSQLCAMKSLTFSSSISISFTLPTVCNFLVCSLDSREYSNTR